MDTINSKQNNTLLIGGIFIAALFYPVVWYLVFLGEGYSFNVILISRLFIWLEVIILFFYAQRIEKSSFLLWQEKSYGFWFYPAAFGALYLLRIGVGIVAIIPKLFGWQDNQQITVQFLTILSKSMPLMVFSAITAGVTEELIFRGYLVPRLELLFKNKYMPVIVSALLFSFNHYRYLSLYEIIFTFLFGVVFAIHYQWYRNIKVLIVTHILIDFISFLLFSLLQSLHLHYKF